MSKLLLTICLILTFSRLAEAQPFQGQKFLAGSFSYFSETDDRMINFNLGEKTRNIAARFNPRLGMMLSDRTAISLGFSFEYTETNRITTSPGNLITSNSYGVVVASRHFFPLGLGLGLYLQPNLSYAWQHGEGFGRGELGQGFFGPSERTELGIGIQPGVYYFLSNKIGLEASLGNLQYRNAVEEFAPSGFAVQKIKSDILSFVGGTQISLGINYFWGRKE